VFLIKIIINFINQINKVDKMNEQKEKSIREIKISEIIFYVKQYNLEKIMTILTGVAYTSTKIEEVFFNQVKSQLEQKSDKDFSIVYDFICGIVENKNQN